MSNLWSAFLARRHRPALRNADRPSNHHGRQRGSGTRAGAEPGSADNAPFSAINDIYAQPNAAVASVIVSRTDVARKGTRRHIWMPIAKQWRAEPAVRERQERELLVRSETCEETTVRSEQKLTSNASNPSDRSQSEPEVRPAFSRGVPGRLWSITR